MMTYHDNPLSPVLIARLRSLAQTSNLVAIAIGVVGLLGWILNISLFQSIVPGLPTMKVNTALCVILSGVAIKQWHRHLNPHQTLRSSQAQGVIGALAGCVIGIALLTLAEYAFSTNLGIDQVLFPQPEPADSQAIPGRMAPNTAITFLSIGLAILRLTMRRPAWATGQGLAIVAWLLSFIGLLGYVYGSVYFYTAGSYTGMAIHTAIAFQLLSVAILCTAPDRGLMVLLTGNGVGSFTARRLLPVAIALPLLVGGGCSLGYRLQLYSTEVKSALSTTLNILVFSGLIGWNAQALNRLDHQRRQAEQALYETNIELEHRVAKRTAELHQAKAELEARVARRTLQLQAANDRLNASQARLSGILDIASDAIISVDAHQTITLFNQGAETIFGYSADGLCCMIRKRVRFTLWSSWY